MARIRVIPDQLAALGGQMEVAAGSLQSVEGTILRGMSSLDWQVRFQGGIEGELAAARARAAALAALSSELARFLRNKADHFTQADQAGVTALGTAAAAAQGWQLPPFLRRLIDPVLASVLPFWGLGSLFGALPPFPGTSNLLWFLKGWPKVLHDQLIGAKHDWWRARLAGDQAGMEAAHQRAERLRALGAKVTEDEDRYISEMYAEQERRTQQTPPAQVPPPVAPPAPQTLPGDLVLKDIPHLMQRGQPWSDITFGPSHTWAQWGCTATSMVMALKHVDPSITVDLDFMQRFKDHVVNDQGLVEWDSAGTKRILREHGAELHLAWPQGQAKAMEMALENLKKGVPSIIGVDGPRSHWVLITGFTGDPANPRPDDFVINDPWTDRNTLAEYFDAYSGCHVDKIVTITKAE